MAISSKMRQLQGISFLIGVFEKGLRAYKDDFFMVLDVEDIEKIWTFGFITFSTSSIFESETFFETPHLFPDFIFQVSCLLIKYLI